MINKLSCVYCGELLIKDRVIEYGMYFCKYSHADEYLTTNPKFRKEFLPLPYTNNNNLN